MLRASNSRWDSRNARDAAFLHVRRPSDDTTLFDTHPIPPVRSTNRVLIVMPIRYFVNSGDEYLAVP
jgi:hypothetical protein